LIVAPVTEIFVNAFFLNDDKANPLLPPKPSMNSVPLLS
jgi:hypothetical protein